MMAIFLAPVIGFVGWLVWRASLRRGPWIAVAAIVLAAAVARWKGPVWIWSVVFGAVLLSLAVLMLPSRPGSWELRHKAARAEGNRDWPYYIVPTLIGVASIAPLVLTIVMRLIPEPGLPGAEAMGVIEMGPDHPIATVDVTLALSGGTPGTEATLAFASTPTTGQVGSYQRLMDYVAFPVKSDAVGEVADLPVALGPTCTDCAYRYRIEFSLDPSVTETTQVTYRTFFYWNPGEYDDVDAETLPSVSVEMTPPDTTPTRVLSNRVVDDTAWSTEHPYDIRRVTVRIDPALVPHSGLSGWPGREQIYTRVAMETGTADPVELGIYHVRTVASDCPEGRCNPYSFLVPVLTPYGRPAPDDMDLRVVDWIDRYDGSIPGGSIRVETDAPRTWLTRELSDEITLDASGEYAAGFDVQFRDIPPDAVGMAVGVLTIESTSGVTISSQAFETGNGTRIISEPFLGCEAVGPCHMVFGAYGSENDHLTWHLGVYYGFFDTATPPPGASISIEVSERR